MRIYQLKTASEFLKNPFIIGQNLSVEQLMQMYAEDVAKRFAAECVNEALGNKMEVSNALHSKIESKYRSIIWNEQQQEETIVQEPPLKNKPGAKDLIYRDISRCSDSLCPKSNICSRFKQLEIDRQNKETLTSVNDFKGREKDGLCDYFIDSKT